ncbi:lysophospholipid acyltransferase family protein [Microlunatus aurantiacus]|uniref:Lysophospholipid acyltransferase family protein n=2 Tax=Microlunatus aurantiacus TaxID=446786 RepID=A0ABP7DWZ0_9ACTN
MSDPAGADDTSARRRRDAEKRARLVARSRARRSGSGAELEVVRADEDDNGEGRGLYWVMRNVLLGPPVKRIFSPIVEGADHVPAKGGAILAANHLSFADWVFMPLALDRRITFVAKSDYFTGEGVKGWAQRRFFAGTGQVPIDRSGGRASEGALRAGMKVLARGDLFGIFPEGTRSHDGRLYKGRTGVARMALEAQVPVIPVAVIGTDAIAPPGKLLSKVMSPTVRFGTPLDFSRYEGMSGDRFILRSVTDEIMYAIMELSGQEYVDMYAPTAKELAAKQAKQDEADEVSPQA